MEIPYKKINYMESNGQIMKIQNHSMGEIKGEKNFRRHEKFIILR